eukprot:CAMPEP_0171317870 /NCGR_PEP_ID=MMETSP0816-20121228/83837_1 /TAXON_ID=420281 /ORGANISM="Proboscia inermis, Strain CCAP1064/1" /LENGTH=259 /DNA_ID=CAMNT_0011811617 /DNA_START=75 /DNA_END=854 /DNA_ORIENTATION=+
MANTTRNDWSIGFFEGAIPQIPLTTLNSVISVCALAHTLYPEKRHHRAGDSDSFSGNDAVVSRRHVAISVGLINVLFCPFGGMPNCHGAGGLAGQHRFGARCGSSVVFLGLVKIVLAVLFGRSTLTLLDAMPTSVLGVMLAIAGVELSTTGLTSVANYKKGHLRVNTVITIVTAGVIVSFGKSHYGALAGWITYMVYGVGADDFVAWLKARHFWSGRKSTLVEKPSKSQNSHGTSLEDKIESNHGDKKVAEVVIMMGEK